jgi:hypothetical protein
MVLKAWHVLKAFSNLEGTRGSIKQTDYFSLEIIGMEVTYNEWKSLIR